MSFILRHKPEVIGISLDEHGYIMVSQFKSIDTILRMT